MNYKLGVLGVGLMGKPIARNLKESGYEVAVYDKDAAPVRELEAAGLMAAASPKELMERSDVVVDVLNDTVALEKVLSQPEGLLEGVNGPKVVIDMTTSDPEHSTAIGTRLKGRGVAYLDCPMTGGRAGAENRELVIMAGGDRAVFDACREILEAVSRKLVYLGKSGSGHYMKLIHNQLSHATFLAACEAYELGRRLGLDENAMMEVFNIGNARSYATEVRFPRYILSGTFDAGASFHTVGKDIGLVMKKANAINMDLPITRATFNYWRYAIDMGRGEEDYSRVVQLMEGHYDAVNGKR